MIALKALLVAFVSLHYVDSKELFDLKIMDEPELNITVVDREGTCVANTKCLSKAEAGPFASLFSTGDPCFKYGSARLCLVNLRGGARYCNCAVEACNCFDESSTTTTTTTTTTRPESAFCHPTKKCLTKEEFNSPGWNHYFNNGDPCFLYDNKRVCFVEGGYHVPCDCSNSECGCKDMLTCDNSKVNQTYPPCDSSLYQPNNTMCIYDKVGKNCGDKICRLELTSNEKKSLVDLHNKYRSRIANGQEPGQPKAANMNKVEWSDEIAVVAQRFADQCMFGHDKVRNTPNFAYVGQNGCFDPTNNPLPTEHNMTTCVDTWYSEVKVFVSSNIEPFRYESNAGHYTQVVWAETKKIGCGISQYLQGTSGYNTIVVCNYGPGGNIRGTSLYKVGEPGSQCPGATENGLCL